MISYMLIATLVISLIIGVKWYIAALSMIHILLSHGIEPDDTEMKSATIYALKKLLKMK